MNGGQKGQLGRRSVPYEPERVTVRLSKPRLVSAIEDRMRVPHSRWSVAVLVVVVVLGGAGCAWFRPPPPAPVVEARETHLVLRLGERRLYLHDEDPSKPTESFLVAIGRKPWETPTGKFRINEMVVNPDFMLVDWKNPAAKSRGRIPPGPKNPLGVRWIGFTEAHGWNVGFHGTTRTEVLGRAVSHGCVRMSNTDVVKVFDRVKLGTTVIVEP